MKDERCLSCRCTFTTGCKLDSAASMPGDRDKISTYTERSKRVPGPLRQLARDLRNQRIDSGAKYYANKEKTL